jgi:cell shape-determining protein MreC
MSDWPQLERRLVDSARQRSRRRRVHRLIALVPVAAALALVTVMLARSPQPTAIPGDERPAPTGTATAVSPTPARTGLTTADVRKYGPIDARVLVDSRSDRYQRVTIDRGTDDGVHRGDPVVNGAGLVGKVEDTSGGSSIVTLITDQSFATSVYVGKGRYAGSITPSIDVPGVLLFEPVDASADVRKDEPVYTTGTTDTALQSRYPPAILLGRVSRIDLGNGDLDKRIHVTPTADLQSLDGVQVLSDPHRDLNAKAK